MIHAIIEATGSQLLLQIRRPATVTVMRSDMRVRTSSDEEWHDMSVSLLTTRLMIFVTSEGEPAGEINLRSVTRLELLGEDSISDVNGGGGGDGRTELAVVTTGETYMLQSTAASNAILKAWYQELQKLAASAQSKVQGDGAAPSQKVNMVWQQGYMEMSTGLDVWEPRFFTLSSQQGTAHGIIYVHGMCMHMCMCMHMSYATTPCISPCIPPPHMHTPAHTSTRA